MDDLSPSCNTILIEKEHSSGEDPKVLCGLTVGGVRLELTGGGRQTERPSFSLTVTRYCAQRLFYFILFFVYSSNMKKCSIYLFFNRFK